MSSNVPKRRLPRFSLRSLILLVALAGSGYGLWFRWEPWTIIARMDVDPALPYSRNLGFSLDGQFAAAPSSKGISVYRTETGELYASVNMALEAPGFLWLCAPFKDRLIALRAVAFESLELRIWALPNGKPVHTRMVRGNWVSSRTKILSGKQVISFRTGETICTLEEPAGSDPEDGAVGFSGDARWLRSRKGHVWDAQTGKLLFQARGEPYGFTSDGAFLLTRMGNGRDLAVWDVEKRERVNDHWLLEDEERRYRWLSKDGRRAIDMRKSSEGKATRYELRDLEQSERILFSGSYDSARFVHDDEYVIFSGDQYAYFDAESGRHLFSMDQERKPPPNDSGDDYYAQLRAKTERDGATGRPIFHVSVHGSVSFLRGGDRFAVIEPNRVTIHDLATGAALTHWKTAAGPELHLAWSIYTRFNPESDTAIGLAEDYTFGVWKRRRPEYWWGVAWLPEFWLTAALTIGLTASLWRDQKAIRAA